MVLTESCTARTTDFYKRDIYIYTFRLLLFTCCSYRGMMIPRRYFVVRLKRKVLLSGLTVEAPPHTHRSSTERFADLI